ncbi:hypothetical protein Cgig2_006584 [Carnegiea gigantea]|uniref:Uncharacterized protein n=1 Tax=Carnegiea gigantea TaxID=171969 RepID=A0A9Q1QMG8_9CARY|nr:hypothetical protein Cgig2_006584 [Carnegiea gigantea]
MNEKKRKKAKEKTKGQVARLEAPLMALLLLITIRRGGCLLVAELSSSCPASESLALELSSSGPAFAWNRFQKSGPPIATPTTRSYSNGVRKFEVPSSLLGHGELIARAQGLKIVRKRRWGKSNSAPIPLKVVDNVFSHLPGAKKMRKSHGRNAK